ncbi:MAG: hypothetical protein HYY55_01360 [Candidatus Niyogibacteria bacterium]|nr:MAG: hypothetical protein HYY55_01360 [Candidatus Niyogibacteria bacterium]
MLALKMLGARMAGVIYVWALFYCFLTVMQKNLETMKFFAGAKDIQTFIIISSLIYTGIALIITDWAVSWIFYKVKSGFVYMAAVSLIYSALILIPSIKLPSQTMVPLILLAVVGMIICIIRINNYMEKLKFGLKAKLFIGVYVIIELIIMTAGIVMISIALRPPA